MASFWDFVYQKHIAEKNLQKLIPAKKLNFQKLLPSEYVMGSFGKISTRKNNTRRYIFARNLIPFQYKPMQNTNFGDFGKNLDPGWGNLVKIYGPGVPNPHPCP